MSSIRLNRRLERAEAIAGCIEALLGGTGYHPGRRDRPPRNRDERGAVEKLILRQM